jgi:hypothetical protein
MAGAGLHHRAAARHLALARAREAEAAANAQPAIDQNATNDPANTGHIPVFNKPLTPDQQDQLLPPQHEGVIAPWTIGGSGRGHSRLPGTPARSAPLASSWPAPPNS